MFEKLSMTENNPSKRIELFIWLAYYQFVCLDQNPADWPGHDAADTVHVPGELYSCMLRWIWPSPRQIIKGTVSRDKNGLEMILKGSLHNFNITAVYF